MKRLILLLLIGNLMAGTIRHYPKKLEDINWLQLENEIYNGIGKRIIREEPTQELDGSTEYKDGEIWLYFNDILSSTTISTLDTIVAEHSPLSSNEKNPSINFFYQESEEEEGFLGNNYKIKVEISSKTLFGKYSLQFFCETSNSLPNKFTFIRICVNDEVIAEFKVTSIQKDYYTPVSGVKILNLNGIYSFKIEYKSEELGTAYIRRARLYLRRIL